MNLIDINSNIPFQRPSTSIHYQNRKMSSSTNSKMTCSSGSAKSSNKSKDSYILSLFVQLCVHPDENYACRTLRKLFLSRYSNFANIEDDFGCNVVMYSLRYQRFRLFDFLLNETTLNFNLRAKDQHGNTILHYAILYSGNDTEIIDKLIEKLNKFAIEVDERNDFGFTPLLLASFCGRYDLCLALLTKTDASPFVRDNIQFKNMFDYIEIDIKTRESVNLKQTSRLSPLLKRESTRLRIQLHHSIPSRQENSLQTIPNHNHKNFFQSVLPQAIHDQSGLLRSSLIEIHNCEYSSSNLIHLINYLHQRYPRIKSLKLFDDSQNHTASTETALQRENSKTNVHQIFNLFDPNLRPKVMPIKLPTHKLLSSTKTPITFKRLGTKITTLATFSRMQGDKKRPSLLLANLK